MTTHTTFILSRAAAVAAVLIAAAGLGVASAQTAPVEKPAAKSAAATPVKLLSLSEIESRLSAEGIKVREVEVRDLLLEVEGYDADGREIEVMVDRRSGEILSRRFDE